MNFLQFTRTHVGHLSEHVRVGGVSGAAEYFVKLFSRKLQHKEGTNIYEYSDDWDLLIILDAARTDAMLKMSSEMGFLDQPDKITSVASASDTWMQRTFTEPYQAKIEKTAYICANPFSNNLLLESEFTILDEVWDYGWHNKLGSVPASTVTDSAIEVGREQSPDRMIVHYMQPHFPSIPHNRNDYSSINLDSFGEGWESIWDDLRAGKVDTNYAWKLYIDNLRYVLKEVRTLINNYDAEKVIISADHGNAFGEWWQWGHPKYVKINVIREVPWYATTANDKKNVETPRQNLGLISNEDTTVEDRLRSLGYKS